MLILVLMVGMISCYLPTESSLSEYQKELWTTYITALPDLYNIPSQHFLCGYEIREMGFNISLNNCGCSTVQGAVKCNWCNNAFWSMVNGFKAIFCHYQDWTQQIVQTMETRNQFSRNWKRVVCPKNQYVNRAQAKIGVDQGVDLGLNGLLLKCNTLDLTN
jgi:hypothetical protein